MLLTKKYTIYESGYRSKAIVGFPNFAALSIALGDNRTLGYLFGLTTPLKKNTINKFKINKFES